MSWLKKIFFQWLLKDSFNAVIKAISAIDGSKTALGILGVIASVVAMYFGDSHPDIVLVLDRLVNAIPDAVTFNSPVTPVEMNAALAAALTLFGVLDKIRKAILGKPQEPDVEVIKTPPLPAKFKK